MADTNEQNVLHHLIEICGDGERGFRTAARHVNDPALQALFAELADERKRFAADLIPHLQRIGGCQAAEGSVSGAAHRGWMTLRCLAPGDRDQAIVVEAQRGERAALDAYDHALGGLLPLSVDWLIEAQREAVRKAHERITAFGGHH
jgi:uncharacterized protein (TIGR02284 family)